ncbi:MAG: hypothetical protein Ct9H300mP25_00410 [Acidobacteriota bacterium]|nr:MAG: hypothetical protein Ct9H300mP25_00410 [Acidobacteriota bacterium]
MLEAFTYARLKFTDDFEAKDLQTDSLLTITVMVSA